MTFYTDFALALSATMVSRSFSYPLHTAIFRIQNCGEPVMFYNLGKVVFGAGYEKGCRARLSSLYSGFGAKLIESSMKKSIKIVCQPTIESQLEVCIGQSFESFMSKRNSTIALAGLSGAILGGISSVVYPFEHLMNHQRQVEFSTMHIIRDKKTALFRGVPVASLRNIISHAIPFAVVEAVDSARDEQQNNWNGLKATFISSILNIIFTGPCDAVISRMQQSKTETALQAFNEISKKGLYEFYRGAGLTLFVKGVRHVLPVVAANAFKRYYDALTP